MDERKTILFTIPMREALRSTWSDAVKDKRESFTFQGDTYLTSYAKYLLEHLDNVLK